jgi:hypothetical protein
LSSNDLANLVVVPLQANSKTNSSANLNSKYLRRESSSDQDRKMMINSFHMANSYLLNQNNAQTNNNNNNTEEEMAYVRHGAFKIKCKARKNLAAVNVKLLEQREREKLKKRYYEEQEDERMMMNSTDLMKTPNQDSNEAANYSIINFGFRPSNLKKTQRQKSTSSSKSNKSLTTSKSLPKRTQSTRSGATTKNIDTAADDDVNDELKDSSESSFILTQTPQQSRARTVDMSHYRLGEQSRAQTSQLFHDLLNENRPPNRKKKDKNATIVSSQLMLNDLDETEFLDLLKEYRISKTLDMDLIKNFKHNIKKNKNKNNTFNNKQINDNNQSNSKILDLNQNSELKAVDQKSKSFNNNRIVLNRPDAENNQQQFSQRSENVESDRDEKTGHDFDEIRDSPSPVFKSNLISQPLHTHRLSNFYINYLENKLINRSQTARLGQNRTRGDFGVSKQMLSSHRGGGGFINEDTVNSKATFNTQIFHNQQQSYLAAQKQIESQQKQQLQQHHIKMLELPAAMANLTI